MDKVNWDFSGSLMSREFIEQYCSTLFPARKNTRILYGIFLELVKQLYSDKSNLLLGPDLIWNNDPKLSKIWIDTEYIWEDNTPEFRPAIYISLQQLQGKPIIGRNAHISDNLVEGEKNYGKEIAGQVAFIHIGKTKGETINLVDNTYEYLDGLADVIKNDFCFDSFNVIGITPLKVFKAEKDHLRGEIVAEFSYKDMWSVKLESPKLKELILSTGQSLFNLIH